LERKTRSSADANKPARRVIGQSKSPNKVPFDMLGTVYQKMLWPWNPDQRLFKVIGADMDRSAGAIYDFLLTLHSNHEPISYLLRDKRDVSRKS